jgi:hypothetical protein
MKLFEQQQRWPEAPAQFHEVLAGVNNDPVLSVNADAHTVLSPQKYWRARIEMQQAIVKDIADYCDLAIAYARAGEKEKALDTLELAATKNNAALKDLNIEPAYDSIRKEPRFQQLVAKMNFPDRLERLITWSDVTNGVRTHLRSSQRVEILDEGPRSSINPGDFWIAGINQIVLVRSMCAGPVPYPKVARGKIEWFRSENVSRPGAS